MIPAEETTGRPDGAVFNARSVTKTYHMGDVDVHALRGVDLDLFQFYNLIPSLTARENVEKTRSAQICSQAVNAFRIRARALCDLLNGQRLAVAHDVVDPVTP